MKKKVLIGIILSICVCLLFIGYSSLNLESAACYSGTGDKCEGQCCVGNPFWCVAGPCDKLFGL